MSARADYPQLLTLQTRWKDNDVYGHVNNVEYYSYFDTAINEWLVREGGLDIHRGDTIGVCAESHCEYRGPIAFPEAIEVGVRVGKLSAKSVRYELAVFRPEIDDPVALGWFVHVFVNRDSRRAVEIPEPLRGALERLVVAEGAGAQ